MDGEWKKYQGALIPILPPHCQPTDIKSLPTELKKSKALFARYTTDFDCGYETEWWYCIKDDKMDIDALLSKERYAINKGLKYVDVTLIDPVEYQDQLFSLMKACYEEYPATYRPTLNYEHFCADMRRRKERTDCEMWGCILKDTKALCGVAICILEGDWVNLSSVKVHPAHLSKQVNAALGYTVCTEYLNHRKGFGYISDGERNIRHQTNYQEYLMKYFGFRRAYCKLHVVYRPFMGVLVKVLYPFRNFFRKITGISFLYNISCTLEQERICRECGKEKDGNKKQ